MGNHVKKDCMAAIRCDGGKKILDFGSGLGITADYCQEDPEWQQKMIDIEMHVSDRKEYQNIAFFHHLIIKKR